MKLATLQLVAAAALAGAQQGDDCALVDCMPVGCTDAWCVQCSADETFDAVQGCCGACVHNAAPPPPPTPVGCSGYGLPADGTGHDPTPCRPAGASPSQAMCVYGDHCMCGSGYVCADTMLSGECGFGTGGSVHCAPEQQAAATGGNPVCWSGAYTAARCCAGAGGDRSCWSGEYTFSFCCGTSGH